MSIVLAAALLSPGPVAAPPPPNPINGVTVWVYDLEGELPRRPTVADGQTPNYYDVHDTIDFDRRWETAHGVVEDVFAGEVRGWLRVPESGSYTFRLQCDDGAALVLDGRTIIDTEWGSGFTAVIGASLDAGVHPLSIPFYENKGRFYLKLEWKRPGAADFELVPKELLITEPGQTYATSPGDKRWFFAEDPRRAGDGRPLESVHPSFTLESFRGPEFRPHVGGMAFLPDGRLAVCTWDHVGGVYVLDNLHGPGDVTVTRFAAGLGEPLGIAVVDGEVYVSQKQEVTRLRDTDGDGVADHYEVVAAGWPMSHNYHEFTFNLVWRDGSFYLTTSVPLKSGDTNYTPGSVQAFAVPDVPGSVLKIDPADGTWEVVARGLRAPNGLGIGVDGELFCCDNQGDWLPSSRLNHIRPGGFYGHQLEPDGAIEVDPPVAWFPHGEIGNSPTEPTVIPDGPYAGHMLVGDVTHGGIKRLFVEKVNGRYQSALFRFSQGLEAGVNRLTWGPDGALYVGGIGSNGNWNWKNTKFGLQRLVPDDTVPFEMHTVEATADGFVVTLTRPAPRDLLEDPSRYRVLQWRYEPTIRYGGPKVDLEALAVSGAEASDDRRSVRLRIPGLRPGRVVHLQLVDFVDDDGDPPFTTECWYTLNAMPDAR